jgi:hypothetical protein
MSLLVDIIRPVAIKCTNLLRSAMIAARTSPSIKRSKQEDTIDTVSFGKAGVLPLRMFLLRNLLPLWLPYRDLHFPCLHYIYSIATRHYIYHSETYDRLHKYSPLCLPFRDKHYNLFMLLFSTSLNTRYNACYAGYISWNDGHNYK